MDTTIRNLDPQIYRSLKARAALTGRNVGDLVNEALRGYLGRSTPVEKSGSLRQLEPVAFADGNEHLSEEIDAIVYGTGAP
jgi:plasmid stability protein